MRRSEKICAECEKPFAPRQDDQRYCGAECRRVGHNARLNYEKGVALRVYRHLQQHAPSSLSRIVASL